MYAKYVGLTENSKLKKHHHIAIDSEFKKDCRVWELFLSNPRAVCRPFIDIEDHDHSKHNKHLNFCTDASRKEILGMEMMYKNAWSFARWEPGYIRDKNPSIQYVELLALCTGIFIWQEDLTDMRIIVNCDNQSVCDMVNSLSLGCKNCMYLIRLLTLNNLKYNCRIFVWFIHLKRNEHADALSRLQIKYFWSIALDGMAKQPRTLPEELWPA